MALARMLPYLAAGLLAGAGLARVALPLAQAPAAVPAEARADASGGASPGGAPRAVAAPSARPASASGAAREGTSLAFLEGVDPADAAAAGALLGDTRRAVRLAASALSAAVASLRAERAAGEAARAAALASPTATADPFALRADRITGSVLLADGAPAARVLVEVRPAAAPRDVLRPLGDVAQDGLAQAIVLEALARRTRSDAAGRYAFDALAPGTEYAVRGVDPDLLWPDEEGARCRAGERVDLRAGRSQTGRLALDVRAPGGAPPSHAYLSLEGPTTERYRWTAADPPLCLEPGRYQVQVSAYASEGEGDERRVRLESEVDEVVVAPAPPVTRATVILRIDERRRPDDRPSRPLDVRVLRDSGLVDAGASALLFGRVGGVVLAEVSKHFVSALGGTRGGAEGALRIEVPARLADALAAPRGPDDWARVRVSAPGLGYKEVDVAGFPPEVVVRFEPAATIAVVVEGRMPAPGEGSLEVALEGQAEHDDGGLREDGTDVPWHGRLLLGPVEARPVVVDVRLLVGSDRTLLARVPATLVPGENEVRIPAPRFASVAIAVAAGVGVVLSRADAANFQGTGARFGAKAGADGIARLARVPHGPYIATIYGSGIQGVQRMRLDVPAAGVVRFAADDTSRWERRLARPGDDERMRGFEEGDVLLAIDGVPATPAAIATCYDVAVGFDDGEHTATVRRGAREVQVPFEGGAWNGLDMGHAQDLPGGGR